MAAGGGVVVFNDRYFVLKVMVMKYCLMAYFLMIMACVTIGDKHVASVPNY